MTTKELAAMLDVTGIILHDRLNVEVKVCDVKTSYGQVRYLVTPIAGAGQVWIDSMRFARKEE